jgi:peptide chain release factor 1
MKEKIQKVIERYEELEAELGNPDVLGDPKKYAQVNKSYVDLEEAVTVGKNYIGKVEEREEWKAVLIEGGDPEMVDMAKAELSILEKELPLLEDNLQLLLIPKDPYDGKNIFLEIRAGTGGDESSIFVGDLLKMYRYYAEKAGWRFHLSSVNEGTSGGYKEVKASIEGNGVYGVLKFESGIHRVQRVPATESQGRVHTSAATVAVLPEADDVDIDIRDEDLKIDTYRASGAGGQHVNKTDSAIRITHLPTGVVVTSQDERSQLKNKGKAMKELQARLLDQALADSQAKEASARKAQVGTGDRSGKIRTYNFPQGRVTDHRINLTLYKLAEVMAGGIQELVDGLQMADVQEKLYQLDAQN